MLYSILSGFGVAGSAVLARLEEISFIVLREQCFISYTGTARTEHLIFGEGLLGSLLSALFYGSQALIALKSRPVGKVPLTVITVPNNAIAYYEMIRRFLKGVLRVLCAFAAFRNGNDWNLFLFLRAIGLLGWLRGYRSVNGLIHTVLCLI